MCGRERELGFIACAMEAGKRLRLIFRDDDILSYAQKSEGLTRSWVLLKPHQHDAVSDLASHLLQAFQLHQSCPHGILLSISGFVLPPFESTNILKDNEIISVRKREDVLLIRGDAAANDVRKLKALGKQPVKSGVLFLTSEEFEKEKCGYESDEPKVESEDDDGGLLEVVENASGANANKRNRKRKAAERLEGSKEKKRRYMVKHSGNTSGDVCKEKKDGSIAGDDVENRDEPAKHSDSNIVSGPSGDGERRKKKRSEAKHGGNTSSDVCKEKKDGSINGDKVENHDELAKHSENNNASGNSMKRKKKHSEAKHVGSTSGLQKNKDGSINGDTVENNDEPANHTDNNNVSEVGVKRTTNVQEKHREIDDIKISPEETSKVISRSTRRKKAKRIWLREMVKIQQQNATCESEGLRNWKEDQFKADRKKLNGQWKGQQKWKNNHADAERNNADDQPKGLLHWKLSSQNNELVKGKRHKRQYNGDLIELPNQNGDVHKQQNEKGDKDEHLTQIGDTSEQPNQNLNDQLGQNCVASKESNHEIADKNEILPIVVRPGHIRFEPLEEQERAVQQDHAPLETLNWNGITSKKKGQQWGKENRRFNPRNEYGRNKEDSDTLTKEKEEQLNEGIDFVNLPPLPGIPKKGDIIAYRVLELSSTWTPELSAHRVGKVSWYNTESNQIMLLPVPEFPVVSEKDDEDAAAQSDNSLYKEDGSLEIDFPSLVDVRVLTSGSSEGGNEAVAHVSEASTGNVNGLETALSGSCDKPTGEPNPDTLEPNKGGETQPPTAEVRGSIWDELSEALNARKEQLTEQNGWGNTPKKVLVLRKQQPSSPGINSGKKAQKPQLSQDNSWGKQITGSKSWSYKALRGSALGPTMAMLRSKNDT